MLLFVILLFFCFFFFFFNDTATTEIYTLSLHDALPICVRRSQNLSCQFGISSFPVPQRSEEHTSELQSPKDLVCRLLLEKKKNQKRSKLRYRLRRQVNKTEHSGNSQ